MAHPFDIPRAWWSDVLNQALAAAPLDDRAKGQWRFLLRQVVDAASPENCLATNPEAMQQAMDSGGASLVTGLRLFVDDLMKGRISMTDESAFEVGRNVATSPGSVVFENELMQLIQYAPASPQVRERPLLIVPPCINDVTRRIARADRINTLGFCIGGTLLACALAVTAARGECLAASMTLLTTMLDFCDPGEIGLLVTEASVAAREAAIGGGGLLQGRELAQARPRALCEGQGMNDPPPKRLPRLPLKGAPPADRQGACASAKAHIAPAM
jgi:polyhydroxyalkanoate synthase